MEILQQCRKRTDLYLHDAVGIIFTSLSFYWFTLISIYSRFGGEGDVWKVNKISIEHLEGWEWKLNRKPQSPHRRWPEGWASSRHHYVGLMHGQHNLVIYKFRRYSKINVDISVSLFFIYSQNDVWNCV
jgi:hypothetical protein